METPTVTVVCTNPNCVDFQQPKRVPLQHVGQGVYIGGPMFCGMCSDTPEIEMMRK